MKTRRRHTKRPQRNRKPHGNGSVVIQITTTRQIIAGVDEAVKTGFYGSTRAAAGERLMSEGLRALLKDGTIKRAKAIDGY
jgi:hypothetical protein